MAKQIDPIRPTDDEARQLAQHLLTASRTAALGFMDPDLHCPMVTRIAIARDEDGTPLTLVSDLSQHTRALKLIENCGLLVGEPGQKGDPLAHPRLSLECAADFVNETDADRTTIRETYLAQIPKAALYVDFGDFNFVRLHVKSAFLNGGFGKAFKLTAEDLQR